jgi:hypothetical protein
MPKSRGRKPKDSQKQRKINHVVEMTPKVRKALEAQRDASRAFGRDPDPGDPVFFDPDAAEPRKMPDITEDISAALKAANHQS